ncbi:MAG: imidazole glycerol phosphate synthase subunit HisH [SAR324 cluster bacterium]|nr:imidazole glycerol phosphate synthase subunit HisH [SAR324 cluster bacterium]
MNVIVDYQAGNLANLKNALDHLGLESQIATDASAVKAASHILMPGVGAFYPAMESLRQSGMMEAILEQIAAGIPFLGICVGLQLLFAEGQENGSHPGLGLIEGSVVRFKHQLKIPQMGWNQVAFCREDPLLKNIPDHSYFYFVHSYHGVPSKPEITLGTTDYGLSFTSVLQTGNIWGVQFHPEKSQTVGLELLKNFCSF